jgi:Spy/CpxP family protein refolding chaperone
MFLSIHRNIGSTRHSIKQLGPKLKTRKITENIIVKITRNKLFEFAAVAALALSGVVLYAQQEMKERRHDPAAMVQHHVDHLTKMLSLTPAQQQQVTTILTNAAASGKSFHEQMRAAHDNLKAAVDKNDTAGIDQASSAIGGLTGQMTATHAKVHAALFQVLTPDQQAKFTQLEGRMHGRHGHEGGPEGPGRFKHGGPGGPPPSPPPQGQN